MEKPVKSLQELAQTALDVQSACNLSGVVHAFSRAMTDLCKHVDSGTDARNQHPICVLFTAQLVFLSTGGSVEMGPYAIAYDWCQKTASVGEPAALSA